MEQTRALPIITPATPSGAGRPVQGLTELDIARIAQMAVQLYAETHPRPPHVTQKQASEMLQLSAPTVSRMVKSGVLRINGAGLVPIGEIDRVLRAHG